MNNLISETKEKEMKAIKSTALSLLKSFEKKSITFLNAYFINDGLCYDFADMLCREHDVILLSTDIFEEDAAIEKYINPYLSENIDKEAFANLTATSSHGWCHSLTTGLFYDSECIDGVSHVNEIPLFKRMVAFSVLHRNPANLGMTRAQAKEVILSIPGAIANDASQAKGKKRTDRQLAHNEAVSEIVELARKLIN